MALMAMTIQHCNKMKGANKTNKLFLLSRKAEKMMQNIEEKLIHFEMAVTIVNSLSIKNTNSFEI